MKNVPIIGKFMIIMSFFGLFAIAVAVYSDMQLTNTDAAYHELLEGNSAAALNLARANRSLQGARASLGDLLMSRTEELNARASAALEKYKADFLGFVDTATVAMPSN